MQKPSLTQVTTDGVSFLTDEALFARTGIRIAFSMRHGGVSKKPYESLNLGAYVDDDPFAVAINRVRFCNATGLPADDACTRINSARQVHGTHVEQAHDHLHEFPDTDALITNKEDVPLLLCFADCVPIILVEPSVRAVAVIHSGWRGTVQEVARQAAETLMHTYEADPERMYAYIGPHIGLQNFTISNDVTRLFKERFGTIDSCDLQMHADGSANLDLAAMVVRTLMRTGVRDCHIVHTRIDTVDAIQDFFSYRAENGITGRHGALACVSSP